VIAYHRPMSDRDAEKKAAALAAAMKVTDGMRVGLGSGSTAAHAVRALGERVRAGLRIEAVPTSIATRDLATREGIPLVALGDDPLDLTIDGADEIDARLRMIKGGGGALLREKVVAHASKRVVIVVDSAKVSATLGAFPLPLEVLPFAIPFVLRTLDELSRPGAIRHAADGAPALTDQGNQLIDCAPAPIVDPESLARTLADIPGVLAHGLFLREASVVLVGHQGGSVRELPAVRS